MNNLHKQQQYQTHSHMAEHSSLHHGREDEYISQFLDINEDDKKNEKLQLQQSQAQIQSMNQFHEQSENKHNDQQQNTHKNQEVYQESSEYQDQSSLFQKSKRSPLHNFQKHFVTTIRRSVRMKWPQNSSGFIQLAQQMWEVFKNSRKYTKQFVGLILGQNDSVIDIELLKKYQLYDSVSQFGEQEYRHAQNYLKQKVLQTFRNIPREKIMYERRIQKKEEFANYFFKVLSEIEQGVMNKRLPKRKCRVRRNSHSKNDKQNIQSHVRLNRVDSKG